MNLQIIRTLIMLIISSFAIFNTKPEPVRLAKKETWTQRNYNLIMAVLFTILIILIMGLFITVCFAFAGNTEANIYYYHLNE